VTSPYGEQQQDDSQQRSRTEDAIVAALAAALLLRVPGLSFTWPARVKQRLVDDLGLSTKAVDKASELALALAQPPPVPYDFTTTTVARVQADAPTMAARYLVAAAKRLDTAQQFGQYDAGARLEDNYAAQANAAAANRLDAAKKLDATAATSPSGYLIWRTQEDSRVEAECAALEGKIFTIDNLPGGKMPGAVHPNCRCYSEPVNRPTLSLVR
jgi:SPP1 gp7 family putative phage head morphogenesis protein